MMTVNPILLTIWAALAVCFLALLMYRGQLTRYEDDQLFLNEDANRSEQEQQNKIVSRINKIEPVLRVFGGAAGLVTACIVGMVVYDAWQRIQ
jgi:hypothetical protein